MDLSVLQLIKHVVLENTIASLNIEILRGQMQLISQNNKTKAEDTDDHAFGICNNLS